MGNRGYILVVRRSATPFLYEGRKPLEPVSRGRGLNTLMTLPPRIYDDSTI